MLFGESEHRPAPVPCYEPTTLLVGHRGVFSKSSSSCGLWREQLSACLGPVDSAVRTAKTKNFCPSNYSQNQHGSANTALLQRGSLHGHGPAWKHIGWREKKNNYTRVVLLHIPGLGHAEGDTLNPWNLVVLVHEYVGPIGICTTFRFQLYESYNPKKKTIRLICSRSSIYIYYYYTVAQLQKAIASRLIGQCGHGYGEQDNNRCQVRPISWPRPLTSSNFTTMTIR